MGGARAKRPRGLRNLVFSHATTRRCAPKESSPSAPHRGFDDLRAKEFVTCSCLGSRPSSVQHEVQIDLDQSQTRVRESRLSSSVMLLLAYFQSSNRIRWFLTLSELKFEPCEVEGLSYWELL
ncbi:hypothetical protein GUJ93_ZPchr0011g28630 [Zizania palustris]|uniref:Uncharacterized protein n=1 Tax=Zizania palustris TaxID=103762 RepID=A0A8J5WK71_ZIZPA|nr:hypothetical protein GUJ93_ZPchr0011g28630 [Zizania palustris]